MTYLFILGAIGTIAWLWMAWAVRRRKAQMGAAGRLPCAAGLLAVCFLRTREAADYFASR